MAKKSGKEGKAVLPAAPDVAEDADVADPGEMSKIKTEQMEQQHGKYGATPAKPHKPPQGRAGDEAGKTSWIEIELVDERNEPVPGAKYCVTLPDGETVAEGTLDEKGWARVKGFEPGECKITFPDLDKNAWEFVETDQPKGKG